MQEENIEEIDATIDNEYGIISHKLSQPAYLTNEQREIIISIKDQPTGKYKCIGYFRH